MRYPCSLTLIAFLAQVAYGFSVTPPRLAASPHFSSSEATFRQNKFSETFSSHSLVSRTRGGALDLSKNSPIAVESKCPVTGLAAVLGSLWGTFGVVYILLKAVKRVLPIALEPFQSGAVPLTQLQLG
jgi:hypothetical protein